MTWSGKWLSVSCDPRLHGKFADTDFEAECFACHGAPVTCIRMFTSAFQSLLWFFQNKLFIYSQRKWQGKAPSLSEGHGIDGCRRHHRWRQVTEFGWLKAELMTKTLPFQVSLPQRAAFLPPAWRVLWPQASVRLLWNQLSLPQSFKAGAAAALVSEADYSYFQLWLLSSGRQQCGLWPFENFF